MTTAHCPRPGLPVVLPLHTPAWLRWRDALKLRWLSWRQQAREQALRAALDGLDARTLRDIGLGEFAARPGATLSALDWERGRW